MIQGLCIFGERASGRGKKRSAGPTVLGVSPPLPSADVIKRELRSVVTPDLLGMFVPQWRQEAARRAQG